MNERIKELAEQAGMGSWGIGNGDNVSEIVEKFAELIVKECVDTLRLVPYTTDREFGDEAIYQEAVLKKFGLKL